MDKILKSLYFLEKLPITNIKTKIDIFCALKHFELSKEEAAPRKLYTILQENLPKLIEETESYRTKYLKNADYNTYTEGQNYIKKYSSSDKIGQILRKIKRSDVLSLFSTKEEFLLAFLRYVISPQLVDLPFFNWDSDLLKKYLNLRFNFECQDRLIKKVLKQSGTKKISTPPFLGSCREYLLEKKRKPYFYFLSHRTIKVEHCSQLSKIIYAVWFNCLDLEYSSCIADTYYFTYLFKGKKKSIKNFCGFQLLSKDFFHKADQKDCIFFIVNNDKNENYFRKSFLTSNTLPTSTFIFINDTSFFKILYDISGYQEFYDFYTWIDVLYRQLEVYISIENLDHSVSLESKINEFINKHEFVSNEIIN